MDILYKDEVIISPIVGDNSFRYRQIMGDNTVTLYYSLPEHVEIPLGAYIVFEGQRYTLNNPANFKKNGTRNFEYTLILDSEQYELSKYRFRNTVPGDRRLSFPLTATPQECLQMLVDNMNERSSGWFVGTPIVESEPKLVSFNKNTCREALQLIADAFETEWQVVEINGQKTIYLKQVEYNKSNPLPLSYGKGNGFLPGLGRMNYDNCRPVEVLFPEGGSRNIDPTTYREYRGETVNNSLPTTLLLPANQTIWYDGTTFYPVATPGAYRYQTDEYGYSVRLLDVDDTTGEEDSVDLTNIYPMRVGRVTDVKWVYNRTEYDTYEEAQAAGGTPENIFCDIFDTTIPEDLNFADYRIPGETATIIFQTDMLAGREFDIEQTDSALTGYVHSERRFRLVTQELDGQWMPNGIFSPQIGTEYAVFHIALPDEYIREAEQNMLRQSVTYLYNNQVPRFTFQGTLDGIWAASRWNDISPYLILGGFIGFSDNQFQQETVPIRITGIRDFINNPHYPQIELSNSPVRSTVYSTIKKLETEEVVRDTEINNSIQFTKRRYQHSRELITLLENAVEGFSEGINPVTVESLLGLFGSRNLQFTYVVSNTDPTPVPWTQIFSLDNATQIFTSNAGWIRWMQPGGAISDGDGGSYLQFEIQAYSTQLTNPVEAYYVYLSIDRTVDDGIAFLSTTPQAFEPDDEHYNLLVGIISSAIQEGDSFERSFAPLYGFTEILPGQITTPLIRTADGNSFWDLEGNQFKTGSGDQALEWNVNNSGLLNINGSLYSIGPNTMVSITENSDANASIELISEPGTDREKVVGSWVAGEATSTLQLLGGEDATLTNITSGKIELSDPEMDWDALIEGRGLYIAGGKVILRATSATGTTALPTNFKVDGLPTQPTGLKKGDVWVDVDSGQDFWAPLMIMTTDD